MWEGRSILFEGGGARRLMGVISRQRRARYRGRACQLLVMSPRREALLSSVAYFEVSIGADDRSDGAVPLAHVHDGLLGGNACARRSLPPHRVPLHRVGQVQRGGAAGARLECVSGE